MLLLVVLEMQEKLEEDRPKSKVEALAELRDYKRRRQSYRAKNPALAKTSATMVFFSPHLLNCFDQTRRTTPRALDYF